MSKIFGYSMLSVSSCVTFTSRALLCVKHQAHDGATIDEICENILSALPVASFTGPSELGGLSLETIDNHENTERCFSSVAVFSVFLPCFYNCRVFVVFFMFFSKSMLCCFHFLP